MFKIKQIALPLALLIGSTAVAQRSQTPWNNHTDYKEKQLQEIISNPPQIAESRTEQSSRPLTAQNSSNRVTVGCQDVFLNGTNIAWVNYGRDIGINPDDQSQYHPDLTKFDEIFKNVAAAGGNSVRWWLHTNCSTSPSFGSDSMVSGLPSYFNSDLIKVLDLAANSKIKVQICLFSFDMLKDQWLSDAKMNKHLLANTSAIDSYITNALIPMVKAVKGHDGLLAWEIFNEPEGMTQQFGGGWDGFLERASMAQIQRFVNKTAGAIHREDPDVLVTSSAWAMTSGTNGGNGNKNYYTDAELIAAGGDQEGTLDIYNLHYYDWAGTAKSPFHFNKDYWAWDKPTVIAEFHAQETFGVALDSLATNLYKNGYAGAWDWAYTDGTWAELKKPIEALASIANPDDIVFKDQSCQGARFIADDKTPCIGADVMFTDKSVGAVSWKWNFGTGASILSSQLQNPGKITYESAGVKYVTLEITNGSGETFDYGMDIQVLAAESNYEISIFSAEIANCKNGELVNIEATVAPDLAPSATTATGSPQVTDWNVAGTQNMFVIADNGTIPGIENAQMHVLGGWHNFSYKEYSFEGSFGPTAKMIISIMDLGTAEVPSLSAYADDQLIDTYTLTATGDLEIPLPLGKHTIKIKNAGNDWIKINKYSFSGLGIEAEYKWYVNHKLVQQSASNMFDSLLTVTDTVEAAVYTAEGGTKCLKDWLVSDPLYFNCLPTALVESTELKIYPNPASDVLMIENGIGTIEIFTAQGTSVLKVENTNSMNISSLANGFYKVRYTSNNAVLNGEVMIIH